MVLCFVLFYLHYGVILERVFTIAQDRLIWRVWPSQRPYVTGELSGYDDAGWCILLHPRITLDTFFCRCCLSCQSCCVMNEFAGSFFYCSLMVSESFLASQCAAGLQCRHSLTAFMCQNNIYLAIHVQYARMCFFKHKISEYFAVSTHSKNSKMFKFSCTEMQQIDINFEPELYKNDLRNHNDFVSMVWWWSMSNLVKIEQTIWELLEQVVFGHKSKWRTDKMADRWKTKE